ncbi:MAG: hypothetical protein K5848_03810 [Lachnospiraceae bacterium]|nr:hypothetical protein [Lachnospiraceae bacterium]
MTGKLFKKTISALCAGLITCASLTPVCAESVTGQVTVDGDASDWGGVTGETVDDLPVGQAGINEFKLAYSEDGSSLLLCYTGTTPGKWYTDYLNYNLTVTKADGSTQNIPVGNLRWYGSGFSVEYVNEATGASIPGDYTVEVTIPMSFLGDNFSVSITGSSASSSTYSASSIDTLNGEAYVAPSEEETGPAVYEGIVVDGKFNDWNAIDKTDAGCPSEAHPDCLDAAAAVFDGDYLYLYIDEQYGNAATGAGTHNNGMFSIVTDLGRNMVIQLNPDGTVSGAEGIQAAHYGDKWEIAVPKSALPFYEETVSFGLYQSEPILTGIANLQEDSGNAGTFDSIVYDGLYADWDDYPHTIIEYATAGTNEILADGEQALYSDGSTLYGHVVSPMIAHTSVYGKEMTSAITIRFNQDDDLTFAPRLVLVDENGNINWNPDYSAMQAGGDYEYYLVSIDAWGTSKNINDLNDMDQVYGKMIISVGGEGLADEAEYYLDLEKIADKLGMDADEFKIIESNFGQIGNEWTSYAGTSTGAAMGIALCMLTCAVPFIYKKKKNQPKA